MQLPPRWWIQFDESGREISYRKSGCVLIFRLQSSNLELSSDLCRPFRQMTICSSDINCESSYI